MNNGSIAKLVLAFVTLIIGAAFIGVVATEGLSVTTTSDTINETYNLVASGCITSHAQVNDTGIGLAHVGCNFTANEQDPSTDGQIWKQYECPLTSVVVHNATGGQSWTAGTDYEIWLATGKIQMLNNTDTWNGAANTTYIDYTYCPDDYMNLSWGRTGINLVPGFFAIALLMVSLGLFYSIAKDEGWI